ncbi:TetR/AcrR family transcriptional regulator [Bacillus sp. WP8]|uniref:TetR/AcrR family transcriptional regulator n=1 Tax=Bacillus sp. WP8 TaxID=756828 RepID=UPI0011A72D9B|nr:TetR/AcrR family transcriptional regulator [Bacillus sp. WP8]
MDRECMKAKERGRPIDPDKNDLILETTLNILTDIGFLNLTMDKIAKEAKVSKAAIYRRWSSKEELVLEAVKRIDPFKNGSISLPIEGAELPLREQLVNLLCHSFVRGNKRHEYFTTILFAALPHASIKNKDLYREFILNLQKAIETIVQPFLGTETLEEKGSILVDTILGLFSHRIILIDQPISKSYIEKIVDKIILPSIVVI